MERSHLRGRHEKETSLDSERKPKHRWNLTLHIGVIFLTLD
jgi:hypothetical protein